MTETAAEQQRVAHEAMLADTLSFERVASLQFGNLTAPVLRQMRSGETWRSLVDMANRIATAKANGHRTNGTWGPRVPAGSLQFSITPRMLVNAALLFTSKPQTVGPDDLRGNRVSITGGSLPQTILESCRGRRLDEIVDVSLYNGALSDEIVRSARQADNCIYVNLDLKTMQPTRDDLEAIRAAHGPSPW